MPKAQHHYVDRRTGQVCQEALHGDSLIRFLYSEPIRERASWLFRLLTSHHLSNYLQAMISFDLPVGRRYFGLGKFLHSQGVDLNECLDLLGDQATPRQIFERKIRYWQCRPMSQTPETVVSPADARLLLGSLRQQSVFSIKGKFFAYEELLGSHSPQWLHAFADGDVAILRLTPDKYHYNHCPVSGLVRDIYELPGAYHSCNPRAVVTLVTPFSKNARVVTIIDTDVPQGSQIGLVAMIEVVALMIGQVVQCYSATGYDNPQPIGPGMFLQRGQPKSLFRPGSSTVVLLLQPGRVLFAQDLLRNQLSSASSIFSHGFRQPLVETEVQVRSHLATRLQEYST